MREGGWKLRIGILLLIGAFTGWGPEGFSRGQRQPLEPKTEQEKTFFFTAKKFGVPILKASIKIENGFSEQGRPLYQIRASVDSYHYFTWLFRMNNRFLSTMEAETCFPIHYTKEIDQEGLLVKRKNYFQTFTFDFSNKKVVAKKAENGEKQEFPISSETYDPLSMFAKYYLKEDLHPGQNIRISIFDGVKMRQMIFYSTKGRVESKMFGEIDAVCLESSTSFSTFGEREGKIRIWYTTQGQKIPVLIELELPIGHIQFELESMEGDKSA